ncbi:AMIN domain-containing protein [Pseudodesulfovibrio cashew]|uniref:AMIN domain-containing protein n=1 Tax=Pseudodesulfovibrio cashew TaxID=2678688 RepID=A0A6I6JAR0_9BACT|nr:AMIN domain-containing protein [Pseudodesulfovibrio cashew]QGY39856.1 AMIN domain-containing protein [Pseudodesulfovibrio cashew]
MSDTRWQYIAPTVLAVLVFAAGLILPCAAQAGTGADETSGWVRMTVDPTVLPPVQPPLMPEENASGTASEADAPQAAVPNLPKEGGEGDLPPEPVPGEMPEPTAQPAPAPAPEPAPAASAEQPEPAVPVVSPEPATPETMGSGVVSSVKAAYAGNSLVLTVSCDRPTADTGYVNLDGPRRLVLDLVGKWTVKTRNVVRLPGGKVKYVVLGEHPDKLRLVVHFRTPPAGRLTPRFTPGTNRLVITIPLP